MRDAGVFDGKVVLVTGAASASAGRSPYSPPGEARAVVNDLGSTPRDEGRDATGCAGHKRGSRFRDT